MKNGFGMGNKPSKMAGLENEPSSEESILNEAEAKRLLIRKLGVKSYTTIELRGWLKEKGAPEQIVEKLLTEFQALGYIDDQAYLASFIRVQRSRKYGPRSIALKLMQKGFSQEEVASSLDQSDDSETIRQLLETKYRSKNMQDPREKQKVVASLMRRGFSYNQIRKGMDENPDIL